MGTIIAYIVIGLIGGAIAKAILPGKQGGGWLATILLGIAGALLGGFLGGLIFNVSYSDIFSVSGLIFSVLSFLVAIPSAIKVFNWTATIYKGSVLLDSPMLYAFGFIGLFLGPTFLALGQALFSAWTAIVPPADDPESMEGLA